jgi:hypothetical protein
VALLRQGFAGAAPSTGATHSTDALIVSRHPSCAAVTVTVTRPGTVHVNVVTGNDASANPPEGALQENTVVPASSVPVAVAASATELPTLAWSGPTRSGVRSGHRMVESLTTGGAHVLALSPPQWADIPAETNAPQESALRAHERMVAFPFFITEPLTPTRHT